MAASSVWIQWKWTWGLWKTDELGHKIYWKDKERPRLLSAEEIASASTHTHTCTHTRTRTHTQIVNVSMISHRLAASICMSTGSSVYCLDLLGQSNTVSDGCWLTVTLIKLSQLISNFPLLKASNSTQRKRDWWVRGEDELAPCWWWRQQQLIKTVWWLSTLF